MHRPHPLLNGSRAGGTWRARARSAFSLIELLVVMFIIVLVISIVVPALAKARQATRVTATKNLMSNLLTSAATFQQDERRLPGRYSGRDMGSDNNANTIGMTMTENILLDLAGGVVQIGGPRPSTGGVHVHPFGGTSSSRASQEGAWVDVGLIGQPSKSGKGYFIPDKKFFIEQVNPSQVGTAGTPDADGRTYPDLVDAFGQPLLVWVEDESTVGRVAFDSSSSGPNNFARVKSDGNNPPARHYWNSNAGFLKSGAMGKKLTNINEESLLGGSMQDTDRAITLAGLLGSPASASEIGSITTAKPVASILPTASRGKIIIHAAGPDGLFLGRQDTRGRAQFTGEAMHFGFNFIDPGGGNKLRLNSAGQPEQVDVAGAFDDEIVSGGS